MKQGELQRKNLAHYLITTTAPHVSYLPKQLLPQQQKQIDRQIREAESTMTTTTTEPQQGSNQDQQDKEQ